MLKNYYLTIKWRIFEKLSLKFVHHLLSSEYLEVDLWSKFRSYQNFWAKTVAIDSYARSTCKPKFKAIKNYWD